MRIFYVSYYTDENGLFKLTRPYPFDELKNVNDRILIVGAHTPRIQSAAYSYARNRGMKFFTSHAGFTKEREEQTEIWRIE